MTDSIDAGLSAAAPGGMRELPVHGVRDGAASSGRDWVADEVPVALEFNGISHAVMLATPLDLEDFALGFAFTEGILAGGHELYGVETEASALGITLRLEVAGAAFARLKLRRRSMAGRTGCGLCGTESLGQVQRSMPPLPSRTTLTSAAISAGVAGIEPLQALQRATGSVHAAAWCDASGAVRLLREDVGRHNALDKLVGALLGSDLDRPSGFVAVTSRASFEMVQKTAIAGVPVLAAVSATTSLAVRTADVAGLTLIGFARGRNLTIYSCPERVRVVGQGAVGV